MRNNLYLLCICTAGFLIAQSSPQEMIEKMGRGINLGNVLSAPVEGNWSGAATEQYFIDVAEAGFKNVRVPIDFYGYRTQGDTTTYSSQENTVFNGSRSDFLVNSTYLNRIEEVVGWGLETIPSSTAARVACNASSTRSFFSFISTSDAAPT